MKKLVLILPIIFIASCALLREEKDLETEREFLLKQNHIITEQIVNMGDSLSDERRAQLEKMRSENLEQLSEVKASMMQIRTKVDEVTKEGFKKAAVVSGSLLEGPGTALATAFGGPLAGTIVTVLGSLLAGAGTAKKGTINAT
jgi:hypothetical protein